MPVLTEPPSMGDVLKYEVNPNYTREVVTLLAGLPYPVDSVLGRITASGKYTLSPATGADGSQVATAVLLYAVDATLADATGIILVRGPSIVSRAALTPFEWERRTGLRLRFIYRRRGPSLLVAEGRLNSKGRAVASRARTGRGLTTAPIFLLVPQVKLRKRLDLARDAERAIDTVPGRIVAGWVETRS